MKANSGLSGLSGLCQSLTRVGPNSPGAGTSGSWADPGNIVASDDSRVSVSATISGTAGPLIAFAFNFAIPVGATIVGVEVSVERSKSGAGVINDTSVSLYRDGAPVGTTKHDGNDWPGSDTAAVYGDASDLWGTTWTATQVNDGGFGVQLDATESGVNDVTLFVDHLTLTVWYQ